VTAAQGIIEFSWSCLSWPSKAAVVLLLAILPLTTYLYFTPTETAV
jgi:hypothetical protein